MYEITFLDFSLFDLCPKMLKGSRFQIGIQKIESRYFVDLVEDGTKFEHLLRQGQLQLLYLSLIEITHRGLKLEIRILVLYGLPNLYLKNPKKIQRNLFLFFPIEK